MTPHQECEQALIREIDRLRAEVDRLRAAQQWKPIETAPKDGSMFIAGYLRADFTVGGLGMAYWNPEFKIFKTAWGALCTHWMPMPKEPK